METAGYHSTNKRRFLDTLLETKAAKMKNKMNNLHRQILNHQTRCYTKGCEVKKMLTNNTDFYL